MLCLTCDPDFQSQWTIVMTIHMKKLRSKSVGAKARVDQVDGQLIGIPSLLMRSVKQTFSIAVKCGFNLMLQDCIECVACILSGTWLTSGMSDDHLTLSQRPHLFTHSWPPALTSVMLYLPGPRSLLLTLCSCYERCCTCHHWHKKVWPWPDANLAWWPTLARCGRSSDIQTRCHHAQMFAWQGSAVPRGLLHTSHWCCRQAASLVSYTATDGGPPTSAIHYWMPSICCARPHGLELSTKRPPSTAGLWVL